MKAEVVMYTTEVCPYCRMAEKLLASKGITEIEKIFIDGNDALREEMILKTGRRTVPQLYVGGRHIGGFDDLAALDKKGELDALLNKA